jgi:hypothetical protein
MSGNFDAPQNTRLKSMHVHTNQCFPPHSWLLYWALWRSASKCGVLPSYDAWKWSFLIIHKQGRESARRRGAWKRSFLIIHKQGRESACR